MLADTLLQLPSMDPTELLSLALPRLADAVGDLLREGRDPTAYVLTVTAADGPVGELLLEGEAARAEDAVCVMLPVETLGCILEGQAWGEAAAGRIARWLEVEPGPDRYRVVAIGRDAVAAITVETATEADDAEDAPLSMLLH